MIGIYFTFKPENISLNFSKYLLDFIFFVLFLKVYGNYGHWVEWIKGSIIATWKDYECFSDIPGVIWTEKLKE